MDTKKIKEKIREKVTRERVITAIGAVVAYTYVMGKLDYRMVKPAYVTDTHVVFNRAFHGVTAVRIEKE